ncbi:MAG: leucine-rich repeat domain-containing protein, partial [Kiritimatiellae bacterium]|nr:leucine-rich repeat domain-containing protein [Kiritimatiellia bacterium]
MKQNTNRMMMMAAISMSVFGWCTALADTWTDDYGRVWTYTVKDGAATVGGNSYTSPAVNRSTVGDIVIPDTLGGCPVTTIAGSAFQECANIRSIVIPDSVTSIKRSAFAYCTSLRLLKFGNGISSINYGTSSQSQFVGGDNGGIKRIVTYDNPFKGCSALAGIEFGTNTMSYLKMSNFSDSKRLSYIYFSGQFPTTVNGTMPGIESRGIYVTHDAYPNGLPQTMLAGVPLKFLEGELPSEGKSWDLIFVSLTANGVLQRPSFFLSAETNSTTSCVRFFEGDPIYCWYSCMDFWGVADIANSFTNVLHLSGTDEVAYSVNDNESTNGSAHYYYWDSQLFGNLQNLPLGEYKATLVLNETRAIQETSYANNTNTITFSVVPSTTITFVSEGNMVTER